MLAKRIIPCLDVKDGRVVKGVNFVGLRDAGDPVELAKAYSKAGADEIVFLDITATHENRDTIADVVRRTCREVFVPVRSAAASVRLRILRRSCAQAQIRFRSTRRRLKTLISSMRQPKNMEASVWSWPSMRVTRARPQVDSRSIRQVDAIRQVSMRLPGRMRHTTAAQGRSC